MKVAYIGDIINHGKSLQTIGTSLVIILSTLREVESIDVYCPVVNKNTEEFKLPQKVKLKELYRYDDALSILKLLKMPLKQYDRVIFNMLPTAFGNKSVSNAVALSIPIILQKIFRRNNVRVIYNNSVFTNDVRALGYNSTFNKIRAFVLSIIERILFKNVHTFVLLNLYKQRIDYYIGKNRVDVMNSTYLEAISTIYLNGLINANAIKVRNSSIPTVLMHGFWGPQKNVEYGLRILKKIKESGINFRLIISGGINYHFSEYETKFLKLLNIYNDVIDEYRGTISEKEIMNLFLEANLLILPYNTPGGHSGVLEQAKFFHLETIVIDFPEYREQKGGLDFINLSTFDELSSVIKKALISQERRKEINLLEKLNYIRDNTQNIVK